ncbi:MAG: hypothetical protein KOO60_12405 [Gemmatimonadales bacterium]|nr:hypothetical protein [Gemmatimonadales bacterium]
MAWVVLLIVSQHVDVSVSQSASVRATEIALEGTADRGAHETVSCTLCHFSGSQELGASGLSRTGKCLQCHDGGEGRENFPLGFHVGKDQDCSRCHSFHSPDEINVPGGRLSLAALEEAGSGHCLSCHGAGGRLADLSEAHRTASNLYHADLGVLAGLSPSQGCLQCHDADSGSPWQDSTRQAAVTFNRHASHPMGIPNRATRAANAFLIRLVPDRKLSLFENRIECQTCHQMTALTDNLVIPLAEKQDLCLGCHQRNDGKRNTPLDLATASATP